MTSPPSTSPNFSPFPRQCLCCFKEYKHLEVFNQLVYALINLVVSQISGLRELLCSLHGRTHTGVGAGSPGWGGGASAGCGGGGGTALLPRPSSPGEDEPVNVERDSAEEDAADAPDLNQNPGAGAGQQAGQAPAVASDLGGLEGGGGGGHGSGAGGESGSVAGESASGATDDNEPLTSWSTEEKEKLLMCTAKIFQIQFPLYTAYKHNTHPTIEVQPPHPTIELQPTSTTHTLL